MNPSKPTIDVCIATYRRPDRLRRLLESLRVQQTQGLFCYRLIVVDNDASRSAEPVVNEFLGMRPHLVYDVEPEQNISLARNRCLARATGDYVALIDDDEYADSRWLLSLYTTMIAYQADVVNGPVIRIFPPSTPSHVTNSSVFAQANPPTGVTDGVGFYTNNSLLRRKLIERDKTPFDPAFGNSGGGDLIFFAALKRRGFKLAWCSEAFVFESVSADRANLFWICQRCFRNGNIIYRMRRHIPIGSWAILRFCRRFLRHIVALPFYVLGSLVTATAPIRVVNSLQGIAFNAGFLAAVINLHYDEYRPPDSRKKGPARGEKQEALRTRRR